METFNNEFFNELKKFRYSIFASIPPSDGFRLRATETYMAGKISDSFLKVTQKFVYLLNMRSDGRYVFEDNFCFDFQRHTFNFSRGKIGRKQLYVGFSSFLLNPLISDYSGVSIGLRFDFRNKQGVFIECIREYEEFFSNLYDNPQLFDSVFGDFGGYTEPAIDLEKPTTAEKVIRSLPTILDDRQFFGKFIHAEAVIAMTSLNDFVDECIRVFDVICVAGYMNYDGNKKIDRTKQ